MSANDDNIDEAGFRANVGIVLASPGGKLLLAGRAGRRGWQFPQGGIRPDEMPREAMYRELHEELGLVPDDVQVLGSTSDWI
ncbi:MAG: NUDIX domain-containing protein, partial [Pseudomonadota bacterium]